MGTSTPQSIVFPALRGVMGDWVYYSCLMSLQELSQRVSYAGEIHKNEGLADMIQRQLDSGRSKDIAEYLRTQEQRFFNSLVVATYGGSPLWHPLEDITDNTKDAGLTGLPQDLIESIGFLTLSGEERLFALDGQHRLAGVKQAVKGPGAESLNDDVSVLFVAHQETPPGLERTRRLFTTLNKTAKPVAKMDIIALDEDDIIAICARRLIEETNIFPGQRIALTGSNNMPSGNQESLTTIGNLYDVLKLLFTRSESKLKTTPKDLQRGMIGEHSADDYLDYAERYFRVLGKEFREVGEFLSAKDTTETVPKYRNENGGKVIFRPLGLELITFTICRLTEKESLEQAVKTVAKLPRDLNEAPFAGLMWNVASRTIVGGHKVTLRETLGYMVGAEAEKYPAAVLLARYRKDLDDDAVKLPEKVV